MTEENTRDESGVRAMAITSIMDNVQKYVRSYSDDDTSRVYLSPEKVMDEFEVDEDEASEIIELAIHQDEELGDAFPSRKTLAQQVGVSEEDLRLLSEDPNGYWKRVKRGFQRQKKAWLVPGNFLLGIGLGTMIDLWYVKVFVVLLVAGDILSAYFHGGLDIK